jgi:uncharacterized membrane protein (UPF0127 family)
LVILCVAVAVVWLGPSSRSDGNCEGFRNDTTLRGPNNLSYSLEVAKTKEAQVKGLSGRPCIGKNQAMLFEFRDSAQHCIWMKDMKFDIDVVWLDDENEVIKTVPNMLASSYPKSYCPDTPTKRVLELPVGGIDNLGLQLGTALVL